MSIVLYENDNFRAVLIEKKSTTIFTLFMINVLYPSLFMWPITIKAK